MNKYKKEPPIRILVVVDAKTIEKATRIGMGNRSLGIRLAVSAFKLPKEVKHETENY